jgi:hypothetical protein
MKITEIFLVVLLRVATSSAFTGTQYVRVSTTMSSSIPREGEDEAEEGRKTKTSVLQTEREPIWNDKLTLLQIPLAKAAHKAP